MELANWDEFYPVYTGPLIPPQTQSSVDEHTEVELGPPQQDSSPAIPRPLETQQPEGASTSNTDNIPTGVHDTVTNDYILGARDEPSIEPLPN